MLKKTKIESVKIYALIKKKKKEHQIRKGRKIQPIEKTNKNENKTWMINQI